MAAVGSILHFLLLIFILLLIARFIVDWVQVFARQWTPHGPALVVLEAVYSTTDPPIKAVRRILPPIRLGGMVEKGSVVHEPDGVTIRFVVGDGQATTLVTYRGIVPDLFREGSGVVAEGRVEKATFVADTILAKHDERYMPPELGNLAAEHKAGKTLER